MSSITLSAGIVEAMAKHEYESEAIVTDLINRVEFSVEEVREKSDTLFGFMAGRMEITGDIESPIPDWKYWRPAECLKK